MFVSDIGMRVIITTIVNKLHYSHLFPTFIISEFTVEVICLLINIDK